MLSASPIALPTSIHPEQRLNIQAVEVLVGVKRSKVYSLIKAGKFPAPERDGPKCSRWRAADVLDYLQSKRAPASEAVQ